MEDQFARLGLVAECVTAITPADISPADLAAYCNPEREVWMSPQSLACNLSHLRVYRLLAERGLDRALILEDDVILSSALPEFLAALEEAPQACSIIRIETFNTAVRLMPPDVILGRFALRTCRSWDAGSAGYLIDNAAAKYLAGLPAMHTKLVDTVIFNAFGGEAKPLSIAYCDPALCIQLNRSGVSTEVAKSDLAASRQNKGAFARRHPVRRFLRRVKSWGDYDLKLLLEWLTLRPRGLRKEKIEFLP